MAKKTSRTSAKPTRQQLAAKKAWITIRKNRAAEKRAANKKARDRAAKKSAK